MINYDVQNNINKHDKHMIIMMYKIVLISMIYI